MERREWLSQQQSLSRSELEKEPNCKLACAKDKEFSCGCDTMCSPSLFKHRHEDEIKKRAMLQRNESGNWYGGKEIGCTLKPNDRPLVCIKFICKECEGYKIEV